MRIGGRGRRSSRARARSAASATAGSPSASSSRTVSGSTSVSSPIASARAARAAGASASRSTHACSTSRPHSAAIPAAAGAPGRPAWRAWASSAAARGRSRRLQSGASRSRSVSSRAWLRRSSPSGRPACALADSSAAAGEVPVEAVPRRQRDRLLGHLARQLGRPRGGRGQAHLPQHRRDLVRVAVLARGRAGRLDPRHRRLALAAGRRRARELGAEAVDRVRARPGGHRPAGLGLQRRGGVPVAQAAVGEQPPPQHQQARRARHPQRLRDLEDRQRLVQGGPVAAGVGEHQGAVAAAEGLHHERLVDLDRRDPGQAVVEAGRRLGQAPLRVVEVVAAHHLGAGRQQRELPPPRRGERLLHQGLGLLAPAADGVRDRDDHPHQPSGRPGVAQRGEVALGRRHAHRRAHPHGEGGELGAVEGGRRPLGLAGLDEAADRLVPALEGRGGVAREVGQQRVGQADARARHPGLGRDPPQPGRQRLALGRRAPWPRRPAPAPGRPRPAPRPRGGGGRPPGGRRPPPRRGPRGRAGRAGGRGRARPGGGAGTPGRGGGSGTSRPRPRR